MKLPQCFLVIPSAAVWKSALGLHVSLLCCVQAPLGVGLYFSPHRFRKSVGVLAALATLASAPIFVAYMNEPNWTLPFLTSTFGFSSFFKSIAYAFDLYPLGAIQDLQTWLLWYVSLPEPLFIKGKLAPIQDGELREQIWIFLQRLMALSVVLTILTIDENLFGPSVAMIMLNSMVYLWLIYTFASMCMEVGVLLLMLQGYKAEGTFDNPLLGSRSYKECWGTRWNKPVHLFLKRTVYVPARKYGIGPFPAALLVFGASGLVHEYSFFIHNNSAYEPGHAMAFFLYVGMLMVVEETVLLYSKAYGRFKEKISTIFLSVMLQIPMLPVFSRLFVKSWLDSGMLESVRLLIPHLQCQQ
jgi:hypothetical protein